MRLPYGFAVADPEFYAPLESAADTGRTFRPGTVPDRWDETRSGVWTMWCPEGVTPAAQGWKVHVSARPGRLDKVLDTAAAVCFEHGVPFKHISAQLFYVWMHGKHAARQQSGKFIAAYPPDVPAARKLMERLSTELAGEEGPYVLTDRRFGDSRTVHYRYGAFLRLERLRADGTRVPVVRDGHGALVEDRRGASFRLPAGITDPFTEPGAPSSGELTFHGFTFERSVRHSNAGGTYHGRETATGRPVFVKEARAHTGLGGNTTAIERLRHEWETLRALHAVEPGLVPEPIAYFREWEHEFLVTELIEGRNLNSWTIHHNPVIQTGASAEEFAAYHRSCEKIVSGVERALDRLHAHGYVFVDVSPGNVMVTPDEEIRLVDFEAASPADGDFLPLTTPGYAPPERLVGDDPYIYDAYGSGALAQLLLFPLHHVVQRAPQALAHLRHDLFRAAPVPPSLWSRAARFHDADSPSSLPAPGELEDDDALSAHLTALRDRTADALEAMADPDHPDRVYPTVPEGYTVNAVCVAYGTAGVLHALRRAGRTVPDDVLARFRREALESRTSLGPGLHVGLSGVAWVLADHGCVTEAVDLLAVAGDHPLTRRDATLSGGASGVALTHLALYGHTGDEWHVRRAQEIADALPADASLVEHIGEDDATGLLHGRTGIALLLHQLAAVTGDRTLLGRGIGLLHAELDRASDPDSPGLSFPISTADPRTMPYLYSGTAGFTHAVSRCLSTTEDERLSAALPALLSRLTTRFTAMPGLYQGLSGLGLVLAEHARISGDAGAWRDALQVARGLFKHAVPHPTGVRFLGDQMLRYSADLWSGSAGVLLFLSHLAEPEPDPFFTVDALSAAPTP